MPSFGAIFFLVAVVAGGSGGGGGGGAAAVVEDDDGHRYRKTLRRGSGSSPHFHRHPRPVLLVIDAC